MDERRQRAERDRISGATNEFVECWHCHGAGSEPWHYNQACIYCNGAGLIRTGRIKGTVK